MIGTVAIPRALLERLRGAVNRLIAHREAEGAMGARGSALGRIRTEPCDSIEDAERRLARIERLRLQHRYVLMG